MRGESVQGLIPARAGTTCALRCPYPAPRGSSPLARGPLNGSTAFKNAIGLIPARAGTTHRNRPPVRRRGAHPRSRGDHLKMSPTIFTPSGSSPLARGPLYLHAGGLDGEGLIPARAGTTFRSSRWSRKGWAHPRSRGDHGVIRCGLRVPWGSSPLARGPRTDCWRHRVGGGLIPARAGTTYPYGYLRVKYWAHPRSRGDH